MEKYVSGENQPPQIYCVRWVQQVPNVKNYYKTLYSILHHDLRISSWIIYELVLYLFDGNYMSDSTDEYYIQGTVPAA